VNSLGSAFLSFEGFWDRKLETYQGANLGTLCDCSNPANEVRCRHYIKGQASRFLGQRYRMALGKDWI
jgi:hypothetical protein